MENTLDVTKGKGLRFEDIEFENTEIVQVKPAETISPIITPEIVIPAAAGAETETKEDQPQRLPKPKFEDLEFETGNDLVDTNEPESANAPAPVEETQMIQAVKAVLAKRMERYGIEAEEVNIADMNEEELEDFEEQLETAILESKWSSIKSVDKNVEKLLSFLENNGDPKEMVSLFKEQEALSKIDITTEDGQAKMVSTYYKNILGWDEEKTRKKMERLSTSGMLAEEAEDVEEAYNEHFEKKQESLAETQRQKVILEQQREAQKRAVFESSLNTNKVPKRLADEYKQTAFGKGIIKGTGEEINILDYKILQLQSNPDMFLKLVQFATDPSGYDAMILQGKKNEEVVGGLKKGFQTPRSTKTADNSLVKPQTKSKVTFNFK